MTPTLESVASCLANTNMLMPLVLGDLTDVLALRRTREGDGPSIAWEVGHMLDYRCQLATLLGRPTPSPFSVTFATSSATDGADYPTVAEFMQHWKQIEVELTAALENASESTIRRTVEDGGPHAGRAVLDVVAFIAFHEAYHMGAIGAIRKAIGLSGPAELVMAQAAG